MSNLQWYSVHFEAVSIQQYIFTGSKLKDIVSASELVDSLCEFPLNNVVKTLDLNRKDHLPKNENEIAFPRATGGAFIAIVKSESVAQRFMALWSMVVPEFVPGLQFNLSMSFGEKLVDCISNGIQSQKVQKNLFRPSHPETTPIMERSPRTGYFTVSKNNHNPAKEYESLDLATSIKRLVKNNSLKLEQKFLTSNSTKDGKTYVFPKCFAHKNADTECPINAAFPFNNDNGKVDGQHYVGLIHADGNALGEFLHRFFQQLKNASDEEYYQLYSRFTQDLENATITAGAEATSQVFLSQESDIDQSESNEIVIPLRPIILGGDDLTVICRADKAFEFSQVFVEAFEKHTSVLMKQLNVEGYSKMTACVGIAFVKSNQPFYMAAHLSESLCSTAKSKSRQAINSTSDIIIPSSLAFHLVSNSLFEDYQVALKQELQSRHNNQTYQTTLGAYQVAGNKNSNLPEFTQLVNLAECFGEEKSNKLGLATLRHLATWIHADMDHAEDLYARWQEICINKEGLEEENSSEIKSWNVWLQELQKLGFDGKKIPFKVNKSDTAIYENPISDVLAYSKMIAQGVEK